MARNTVLALVALVLAGCGAAAPVAPAESSTAAPSPGPSAAGSGASPATAAQSGEGRARNEEFESELYSFSYSYPAEAGAVAGVRAMLYADLEKQRAEIAGQAAEAKRDADKEGYPYRPHSLGTGWEVVANLPDWLSLSAGISSYSGGAHGNFGFDALLWDKRADKLRGPLDLFRSERAFAETVQGALCAELDRQRAEKLGAPVPAGSTDMFDECIDPNETVIILGSSNRKTFDRIGFLIAPYIAGPYAEGDYEVTLPVTAALLATVKPQFRASFSVKN